MTETLAPSGRVLRRTVTDLATSQVTEDTVYGYASEGDSPAYSRPASGGALTTYITGPGGLLAIDTAAVPSYPLTNAHGDIAGRTDAAGAFAPESTTDEFGVGQAPQSRLGWLGGHQRYDPNTNRCAQAAACDDSHAPPACRTWGPAGPTDWLRSTFISGPSHLPVRFTRPSDKLSAAVIPNDTGEPTLTLR